MTDFDHGIVFDIKRFAIHDGDGIRTTLFLKGCPLRCPWCHNPEGRDIGIDLSWFSTLCVHCGICEKTCKHDAIKHRDSKVVIDHEKCVRCGDCCNACPSLALKLDGKSMTVDEVMDELLQDNNFYKNSNGGVTISGGDPLYQHKFATSVLKVCKEKGINTAIETCLFANENVVKEVLEYTDKVFLDIKLFDDETHEKVIGVSNKVILNNFKLVAQSGVEFCVRIPVIPDYTGDDENIRSIAEYVYSIAGKCEIELLNYNPLAENKYNIINEEYKPGSNIKPLTSEQMEYKRAIVKKIMEANDEH